MPRVKGRRLDHVEITFARPRGIIGVHLYTGTKVSSSWPCTKGEISQRGTLAQVVRDLSLGKAASIRPYSLLCSLVRAGSATCTSHGSGKEGKPRDVDTPQGS